ncbi:MAG: hypothetical protein VX938_01790, partial [Myxococcota bacterium]|nr:hypothetical protein [Myxococcota bacterium]
PLGSAPYALHAATAASASALDCTGCIPPEALSNEAVLDILDTTLLAVQNAGYVHEGDLAAGAVPYDGAASELGATDVQGAIDELKALIEEKTGAGAGGVNEGAGQVIVYEQDQAIAAYGTIRRYVHLVNPATPKVMAYVYGDQASSTGGSDNLVVAYDFAPNEYSAGVIGTAGETSIQVEKPSIFSTGSHILLHQTVGGGAYEASTWELAKVVAVNGNTLQLVQPLENSYGSDDIAKAQAVVGASFGHLEVVSGGKVRPSKPLAADGSSGGIVYIRANKISVRSGGVIEADGLGAYGGGTDMPIVPSSLPGAGPVGPSGCVGSGGGSNAEQGQAGVANAICGSPGQAGAVQGTGPNPLTFGGAGAPACHQAICDPTTGTPHVSSGGGNGGGIVLLGAQQLILQEGGRISASGGTAQGPGSGGGAGGTIGLYAKDSVIEGTLEALGGPGGESEADTKVLAPTGWDYVDNPTQNTTKSMDTHSHGGGYSPLDQEFWYPSWSGSTVYRHAENGAQIGQFESGTGSIMQVWGGLDGAYYTANWGNDRVYRWEGEPNFSTGVWDQHIGGTAAGVCSDGYIVYAVRNS